MIHLSHHEMSMWEQCLLTTMVMILTKFKKNKYKYFCFMLHIRWNAVCIFQYDLSVHIIHFFFKKIKSINLSSYYITWWNSNYIKLSRYQTANKKIKSEIFIHLSIDTRGLIKPFHSFHLILTETIKLVQYTSRLNGVAAFLLQTSIPIPIS